MDLWEVLKVVARRWVFVVPVLVVTAALAVLLPPQVDPTYSATGSVVLVAPPTSTLTAFNPYFSLGTTTTAQAIALSAGDEHAVEQVVAAGNSPAFSVKPFSSRSPILLVTAEAATAEQAVATVEQVVGIVQSQLQERQTTVGAPIPGQISTQLLTPQVVPAPVYDGRQRVLFLTIGLGVVLAVVLALAVDGVAQVRQRRRQGVALGPSAEARLELVSRRMDLLDEREKLLADRERLLGLRMVGVATSTMPSPAREQEGEEGQGPAETGSEVRSTGDLPAAAGGDVAQAAEPMSSTASHPAAASRPTAPAG